MLLASFDWNALFFVLFALLACGFAIAVVFTANIVRMAFYLILSLGSASGLFFLAGAEFVGAMQLMIYVGGTLVLLIFGVMLTAQQRFVSMHTSAGEWVMAVVLGSGLFLLLLQAALSVDSWRTPHPLTRLAAAGERFEAAAATMDRISQVADDLKGKEEGLSEGQAARMLDQQAEVARELTAVASTMDDVASFLGDASDGITASLEQAEEKGREVGKKLADIHEKGSTTGRLESLTKLATDAATRVRAAGTQVARSQAKLAVPLAESKTSTQIGLAFAGVRVDTLDQADPEARAGMSGYLLPFVIVSIHLLVVLVGAAYLARTKRRVSTAARP